MLNEVVTDLLKKWSSLVISKRSNETIEATEEGLLHGLERDLYSWSIECKPDY